MRRSKLSLVYVLAAAILLLLAGALAACGGGGGRLGMNQPADREQPQDPVTADDPAEAETPRNLLRLASPALASLAPGSEFDVTLDALTIEALFQASARLLYDPAQLAPVKAEHGRFGQFSVALTRADHKLRMTIPATDSAPAGEAGYVPFAFTGLPDTGGLAPQELRLLTVRFRVLAPLSGNAGLRLHNDPAYLQLRGPDNRRLSFDLSEEVAAR